VPARRAVNLAASVLLCSLLFAPRSRGSAEPASPPCPPSPAIAQLTWAPKETIRRFAPGSDNFPLTWADDDALYTTFGDGRGFQPLLPTKLSLGFARITGSPDNFTAANVRSPTGEQLGDGRRGPKGWGLLCVNGVLYLWTGHADRNGAQAQLAWSKDHAKTWTFADWKFPEFGLIGFVNHGRDNASAPDDFAYAYSHDHPRADTPADQFILMRVPDDRITDRTAYEFFTGLDAGGNPTWSPDGSRRRPVFEHEEACLRSAMTYNPGIKRYLWWQHVPRPPGSPDRGDTRFEGGFGIYDAPTPWGPWTTVYFTDMWDVGPGEHGDFPAKWISPDGLTLHLVFSGDDQFSVRKAQLTLTREP
jgi:hypothetical protein